MARKKSAADKSPATETRGPRLAGAEAPFKKADERATATEKKSARQRAPKTDMNGDTGMAFALVQHLDATEITFGNRSKTIGAEAGAPTK